MKQIKLALLCSVIVSLCVAPAVQAINMQNLKQKTKGLGWSALSLGLALRTAGFALNASHTYSLARQAEEDDRDRKADAYFDRCNLNALLSALTGYLAYKSGEKAIQAFKKNPDPQPA